MKNIRVMVNGEEHQFEGDSLVMLLEQLALPVPTLLIEKNGVALHRHELAAARLSDGDQLEILRVAAGG